MRSFAEASLPDDLWARLLPGATVSLERAVAVTALASGAESRIAPWADGRRRFRIGPRVLPLADGAALLAFFEARRGRLQGFRLRDPTDEASAAPGCRVTPQDQRIGTGDGATRLFSLAKAYGAGEDVYLRPIAKPVAGSVRVAVDGAELDASAFAADSVSGRVTLAAAPAAGAAITAGFRFDTAVRLEAEAPALTLHSLDRAEVAPFTLIEVRP